jgi:ABC-type phosphate transport system auxiliary subunit
MDIDERVPGVTFAVEGSSITATSRPGEFLGKVALRGTVTDIPLWEEVVKKLQDRRIYSSNDIGEELRLLLKEEIKQKDEELAQTKRQLHQEEQRHQSDVSRLEAQHRDDQLELSALRIELDRLHAMFAATSGPRLVV